MKNGKMFAAQWLSHPRKVSTVRSTDLNTQNMEFGKILISILLGERKMFVWLRSHLSIIIAVMTVDIEASASRVLELSDRFLDVRSEGMRKSKWRELNHLEFSLNIRDVVREVLRSVLRILQENRACLESRLAGALQYEVRDFFFSRWVTITFVCFSIRVGKVDCTRFKSVCQAFKVQGYPTIIL